MASLDELEQRYGLATAPATSAPLAPKGGSLETLEARYGTTPVNNWVMQEGSGPTPSPKPKDPGIPAAVGYGLARGASLGFVDRLAGVGGQLGDDMAAAVHGLPLNPNAGDETRAEYLKNEDAAASAHQGYNTAAQIAGGVLPTILTGPVAGAATKAAQGGSLAVRAAARVAAPALEGALAGAGNTRADDPAEIAKNAAGGAAVTGAVAGAGELAKEGITQGAKAVKSYLGEGLRRRVLNEVADGTASTTPTGRKRLDASGDSIVKEVVKGPEGDTVREAYQTGGEKGMKQLAPIIDRVAKKNEIAYSEFDKAGQHEVDVPAYLVRLKNAALAAGGQERLASGIDHYAKTVEKNAARRGGLLTLGEVRQLTTEAQGIASGVLGSLNEHANAKVARQVGAVVTEAMDDTLSAAAQGNRKLEQAAARIRLNNKRMNALLTIEDGLQKRAYKENTGKSLLVRTADQIAVPAALGAAGGSVADENRIEGAAGGALAGAAARYGIPAGARMLDRGITTAAIKAARGQVPFTVEGASKVASAIAKAATAERVKRGDGAGHYEVQGGHAVWVPD